MRPPELGRARFGKRSTKQRLQLLKIYPALENYNTVYHYATAVE